MLASPRRPKGPRLILRPLMTSLKPAKTFVGANKYHHGSTMHWSTTMLLSWFISSMGMPTSRMFLLYRIAYDYFQSPFTPKNMSSIYKVFCPSDISSNLTH